MNEIEQMPVDMARREMSYRMANVVEVLTRWECNPRTRDRLERTIEEYKKSRERCKTIDLRAYNEEINQRLDNFPDLNSIPRL